MPTKKELILSTASKYVPAIRWLRSYNRVKFVSDVVAGITVGITMIPQSIAYAALAGLTPQFGLNSAFVGCFVYAIFGTIKEVAIGPTSLMAILSATYTRHNTELIIFLTFLTGCVEFIMGVLKLGFLVDFISVPVISGFVSAISVAILVSQLKDLMGLKFKTGGILQNFISVIKNADKIRCTDFALGVICIVALLAMRSLKDVKFKEKKNKQGFLQSFVWFISISRNAVIVLICIVLSAWFEFYYDKVPFVLTASVNAGLPEFKLPPFSAQVGNVTYTFVDMFETIGSGMVIIPIVQVLENIAIAKAFSKGKTVDATQEMFALSFSSIVGSCFGAMPTCGALTRGAVSKASGVETPLASLYSGTVVLLAVTFLSPYFHLIPRATLAAVLICAIVFLIEWEMVIPLWKTSKKDFFIMMATFFISITCGVEIGLLVGVALSVLRLVFLWACPKITSEICTISDGKKYVILTIDKGLYFLSLTPLRDAILRLQTEEEPNAMVINCLHFSGVDFSAVKELSILLTELNEQGQRLFLLNGNPRLIELCHTIGHCNEVLSCSYKSKEEIEFALTQSIGEKEMSVVQDIKSKDYSINSSDVKTIKELHPLLEESPQKKVEV